MATLLGFREIVPAPFAMTDNPDWKPFMAHIVVMMRERFNVNVALQQISGLEALLVNARECTVFPFRVIDATFKSSRLLDATLFPVARTTDVTTKKRDLVGADKEPGMS